jgi:GTPase SAR1 family protein
MKVIQFLSVCQWREVFSFPLHFQIQLWDTAGQERFRKSMVQHYYRNVHAVVFVYDMTSLARGVQTAFALQ